MVISHLFTLKLIAETGDRSVQKVIYSNKQVEKGLNLVETRKDFQVNR